MDERTFSDRHEAGRLLAEALVTYPGRDDVVVLALPRGGVPVGFEVARALEAPLDVIVVRKLGTPGHEELAMGAIASGGVTMTNEDVLGKVYVDAEEFDRIVDRERGELRRREERFRGDLQPPEVGDKTVIVVDDGIATGSTMRAALEALRQIGPSQIVMAVPVASPDVCEDMRSLVEDLVCLQTPTPLFSVGTWYREFSQTTDDEVSELLSRAAMAHEGR